MLQPRSIVGWFALCWVLFLIAAIVVGTMLVALYDETTSQRIERGAANLARACESILHEASAVPSGNAPSVVTAAVSRALGGFNGVEGGVWRSGSGSLAYAFPSYEGTGAKTDLPQAEEPTIRQVAEGAAIGRRPVEWKRDARSQVLLVQGCPFPGNDGLAAWTMTRVVTVGGRSFLMATTGLGLLLLVLLGSAALLARVLWRWSQRLRTIEQALSKGWEDLPLLETTGQRDLDRIIAAINGAGAKASESRRRSEELRAEVAEGERLAALGRVAAGIAHEIRNPIAAMRLKAENALAEQADPVRARDALRVVIDQVARMDQLLQNMLRSVQRTELRREPVADIRGLLAERADLFREQAGGRSITVSAPEKLDPAPRIDASQIGRALDNLILNAIQNSADGGRISLCAGAAQAELTISVSDNGHGVPSEVREHLFEPFSTGRPEGTGLGLAIVREIAEAHGGQVKVHHRADGTTFSLALPVGGRS
ncbi:MAG TPA: HAMP domain-containing sensor histidine kinase [Rhizomicrobium sp.]